MTYIKKVEATIEFYTEQETGISGMSQSGLAKLCGVPERAIRELLQTLSVRGTTTSDLLKPLLGQDYTLAVMGGELNNARVVKDFVCQLLIEYYAFESKAKNEEALFSFRKLARMVIPVRQWIQEITGWNPPLNKPIYVTALSPSRQRQVDKWREEDKTEEWIAIRLQTMDGNNYFKENLEKHGVKGGGERWCQEEIYRATLGGTKSQLLTKRNASSGQTVRDTNNILENAMINLAEVLSATSADAANVQGYKEYKPLCTKSGEEVKKASNVEAIVNSLKVLPSTST